MPTPLTLACSPTKIAIKSGQEATLFVQVKIKASAPGGQPPRPKLSAVLAIDTSGSMSGQPLEHVARSAERIVDLLSDGDELGVVSFSSEARAVAKLEPLTAGNRKAVQRSIRQLRADGGTNVSAGLKAAAELFPPRQREQRIILLLSDGQPNVGPSSSRELAAEAGQIKSSLSVTTSTLGYGSHHDEKILINIAELGGGRYAFVSEPQLAESSFVQALGTQLDVVAEGPRLVLTPSEDADIVRVLGDFRTSIGSDGLRVALRDLAAGDELSVVVEMKLRAWREGDWRLLYAALTAQEAGGAGQLQAQAFAPVKVAAQGPELLDAEALAAVNVALADEVRTKARGLSERGDFDGAVALLKQALSMLEGTPGFARGKGDLLSEAYEALVDDVTVYEQRPSAERSAQYNKAQQDYLSLSKGGASYRAMSPAAQAMAARRNVSPAPRASVELLAGPGSPATFPINADRTVLGRGSTNDVQIHSPQLSRQHAVIERLNDEFWLIDLGSTNGVEVGGKRINRHCLRDGDTFYIGDVKVRFTVG